MSTAEAIAGFGGFLLLVTGCLVWVIRDWERTRARRHGPSAVEQTRHLEPYRPPTRWSQ